jgi:hypothetical protein
MEWREVDDLDFGDLLELISVEVMGGRELAC